MDTRDCLYFMTIAEAQSFSRAAEQMYLTQPYLSRWIARLESQMGVKLFDRSRYPIRLTEEGLVFLEYASKFLKLEKEMCASLGKNGRSTLNVFSIGTAELTGTYILPVVVAHILKKYPALQVSTTEKSTQELEKMVADERLDLAFVFGPNHLPDLQYEPINQCRVIMVISPRNKLYSEARCNRICQADFTAEELKGFRFLASSMAPGVNKAAMDYLRSLSITPASITEKGSIEQTLKHCINGSEIAFVPDISISYSVSGLIPNYYEVGDAYKVNVSAVYKRMSPEIKDAIQWTRKHWEKNSCFPVRENGTTPAANEGAPEDSDI